MILNVQDFLYCFFLCLILLQNLALSAGSILPGFDLPSSEDERFAERGDLSVKCERQDRES